MRAKTVESQVLNWFVSSKLIKFEVIIRVSIYYFGWDFIVTAYRSER